MSIVRVVATGTPEALETYVAALDLWFSVSAYRTGPEEFVAIFDADKGLVGKEYGGVHAVRDIDLEEIQLAYLPGDAVRIRARAAGRSSWRTTTWCRRGSAPRGSGRCTCRERRGRGRGLLGAGGRENRRRSDCREERRDKCSHHPDDTPAPLDAGGAGRAFSPRGGPPVR